MVALRALLVLSVAVVAPVGADEGVCAQDGGCDDDHTDLMKVSLLQAKSATSAYEAEMSKIQVEFEERRKELEEDYVAAQKQAMSKFVVAKKRADEEEAGQKCMGVTLPDGFHCCTKPAHDGQASYSIACGNAWRCCLSPGRALVSCLKHCPRDQQDITHKW
eukprot:TRINITY_DN1236_c0_g1_i1.p1 TRINITY_DN1236_c0_g1~~TRINITY_DN1236_c0_g1_i1.p1  ORF type:complete len:162 (+),score=42.81 TRINITY_DN1236_c0_g1_i1:79-564(+)